MLSTSQVMAKTKIVVFVLIVSFVSPVPLWSGGPTQIILMLNAIHHLSTTEGAAEFLRHPLSRSSRNAPGYTKRSDVPTLILLWWDKTIRSKLQWNRPPSPQHSLHSKQSANFSENSVAATFLQRILQSLLVTLYRNLGQHVVDICDNSRLMSFKCWNSCRSLLFTFSKAFLIYIFEVKHYSLHHIHKYRLWKWNIDLFLYSSLLLNNIFTHHHCHSMIIFPFVPALPLRQLRS